MGEGLHSIFLNLQDNTIADLLLLVLRPTSFLCVIKFAVQTGESKWD